MAIIVIAESQGASQADDAALVERLSALMRDHPPHGVQVRMSGPSSSGRRIVSVWDSQSAFETYHEHLKSAMSAVGLVAPVVTDIWPIDDIMTVALNE
jgi:hypothetical protein